MADSIKLHPEERLLAEEGAHFNPSTFQPLLENYLKLVKNCSDVGDNVSKSWPKLITLYKRNNIETLDHYHRKMRDESIRDNIKPEEQKIGASLSQTIIAAERVVAARLNLLGPQEQRKEQERLAFLSQGERDREILRLTQLEGDDIYQEGLSLSGYGLKQIQARMLKVAASSLQFDRENEAALRHKYGPYYDKPSTSNYNNANSSFANSAYNAAQFRAQQSYNQQQANQNWQYNINNSINNMSLNR
jgi:hypothetical protein